MLAVWSRLWSVCMCEPRDTFVEMAWPPLTLGARPLGKDCTDISGEGWREPSTPYSLNPRGPSLWWLVLTFHLGDDSKYSHQTRPLWLCFLVLPGLRGCVLQPPFPYVTMKGMCRWHDPQLWFFSLGQMGSLSVEPFESWCLEPRVTCPRASGLWKGTAANLLAFTSPAGPSLSLHAATLVLSVHVYSRQGVFKLFLQDSRKNTFPHSPELNRKHYFQGQGHIHV